MCRSEDASTEAMRYISARLHAPPDVESSGACRGEGASAEAMRYVSTRLHAPPDVESSGTCRSEDVSAEAMQICFSEAACFLLMWRLRVRVGARTPRAEAMRYVSARLHAPPDVESSGACRSEDASTEAMRYISARLRAPPDVESSGMRRGEGVSAEATQICFSEVACSLCVGGSQTFCQFRIRA